MLRILILPLGKRWWVDDGCYKAMSGMAHYLWCMEERGRIGGGGAIV